MTPSRLILALLPAAGVAAGNYAILARLVDPAACPSCANAMRPDVALFGELLPPGAFEFAAAKASMCELCFVIGTSALVYPAAGLPEIARSAGAYLCEVNPERTPLSSLCDEVITEKAGEALQHISNEDSLL